MSIPTPQIDLMTLADIGNPKRLALEIHKQLRQQYGTLPTRMPLDAIAEAVGIVGIKEFQTSAFDGTLVAKDGTGAIGLRKGMPLGRRNFTLGHELGHFLIPTHQVRGKFECVAKVMRYGRGKAAEWEKKPEIERIEVEANEFSATLLVPVPEFREERAKLGRTNDVTHVRALALTFAVSQEMMARIYVAQSTEKSAIILSQNGVVKRVIPKSDFPYLGLRAGAEVPRLSLTKQFQRSNHTGFTSSADEVDVHTWLETQGAVTSVVEQVALQRDGWATTLLTVEEEERDDDTDDRSWNRSNSRWR
jgi:Zn-dependent peptidase ImmA (M78 family)